MRRSDQREYHRKESNFTSGLFWGLILGIFGALLFATKKGKKLRDYLSENGQNLFDELEDFYQESGGEEMVKKITDSNEKIENQNLKKKTGTKSTEVKSLNHIEKLQERGRKASKHFFKKSGKTLK